MPSINPNTISSSSSSTAHARHQLFKVMPYDMPAEVLRGDGLLLEAAKHIENLTELLGRSVARTRELRKLLETHQVEIVGDASSSEDEIQSWPMPETRTPTAVANSSAAIAAALKKARTRRMGELEDKERQQESQQATAVEGSTLTRRKLMSKSKRSSKDTLDASETQEEAHDLSALQQQQHGNQRHIPAKAKVILEAAYRLHHYLTKAQRDVIVRDSGLTNDQVITWFKQARRKGGSIKHSLKRGRMPEPLDAEVIKALTQEWLAYPRPDKAKKQQLAKEYGETEARINNWFQHRNWKEARKAALTAETTPLLDGVLRKGEKGKASTNVGVERVEGTGDESSGDGEGDPEDEEGDTEDEEIGVGEE